MRQTKHLAGSLAFLCAAVFFLAGADRGVSPTRGGTLPLRGGTLPLRIPADGVLPLVIAGDAAVSQSLTISVAMDLELTNPPADEGDLESMPLDLDQRNVRPQSACSALFGPLWADAAGTGRVSLGGEDLDIASVCRNEVSNEVALVATLVRADQDTATCFLTGLRTSDDLDVVTGDLSCTAQVAGVQSLSFELAAQ